MRKILLALATFVLLAAGPALAGKAFAPYEKAKFDALIQSGAPIVVHVHADWCIVCRGQIAVFNELIDEPAFAKVEMIRVNYDNDRDFLAAYGVTRQSTIIAFKNGQESARLVYDTNAARIRATLEAAL